MVKAVSTLSPHRREGYRYWDIDGREVLDLHLNGGTFNLGHCHPELVACLVSPAREWDIGNHHFPLQPKALLAKMLLECMPGLGRTGQPWAIQAWGVEPDMLVTGKGLSGGLYPMAALVMTEACGKWLQENGWGHVSTFGGADLGCHVAMKALQLSLADATLENVCRQAEYLRQGLEAIKLRFPFFVSIRQKGLVMGLQFDSSTTSYLMMKALYESGIWAIVAAFDETVIQFKSGLLIDIPYCDEVLQRFEQACIWFVANANNVMMEVSTDTRDIARANHFAHAALHAWGCDEASLELIKHRENTVYRVCTGAGQRYALRIHRAGYHSGPEILSEIQWMQALAARGIATAEPIANSDGDWLSEISVDGESDSRFTSIFAWREGVLFDNLGAAEQGMVVELTARYRQLGALAARVHNQGETWQPPPGFTRHSWDEEGLLGEDPLWGRFWEHPLMSPSQRQLILKARIVLRELLAQVGKGADCYGLIHADFLPDNILMHEDKLCLIDFDDCGYGWHMFEMATSLFPKITEPYFDDLVNAYVAGYRSERVFSEEHLEIFPAFILLRGLTYLGWLMNRAEGLVNRDRIATQIIEGLSEHIPELLDELTPLQRIGVDFMAWRQARRLG